MKPGHLQKYVIGPPMAPCAPAPPKSQAEFQLEIATNRLEDLAARYAACTSEYWRDRLAAELEFQRRAVDRLKAQLAAEAMP